MKATIWHNPTCGTSRKTLAILQETPGVDLTVVEYLKTPYEADKLRQLFEAANISARDALRLRGTDAAERGMADWSEDAIIAAMDKAIGSKKGTYDFARLMDGATEVKCSEFADELIKHL